MKKLFQIVVIAFVLSVLGGNAFADGASVNWRPLINKKENSLGNPSVDGYCLKSTAAGVRSWGACGSGGDNLGSATYADIVALWSSCTGYIKSDGTCDATPLASGLTTQYIDWSASSGGTSIKNKPTLFSGAYADLTGKPSLFSGAYSDLSGKPTLGTAAAQDVGYFALYGHNHTGVYEPANANIQSHISSTSNPHSVTKSQVGLGNVPDTDATNPANINQDSTHRFTTDTEKAAWAGKQDALGFTPVPNTRQVAGHALSSDVTISKSDVGLTNVDNTSDANKPVSSATQTALNNKSDTTHNHAGVYEPANSNIQAHINATGDPHNIGLVDIMTKELARYPQKLYFFYGQSVEGVCTGTPTMDSSAQATYDNMLADVIASGGTVNNIKWVCVTSISGNEFLASASYTGVTSGSGSFIFGGGQFAGTASYVGITSDSAGFNPSGGQFAPSDGYVAVIADSGSFNNASALVFSPTDSLVGVIADQATLAFMGGQFGASANAVGITAGSGSFIFGGGQFAGTANYVGVTAGSGSFDQSASGVTYVGASALQYNISSNDSGTMQVPSGMQDGDLMILFSNLVPGTNQSSPGDGWTLLAPNVYYKFKSGTQGDIAYGGVDGSEGYPDQYSRVYVFRGVNQSSPFDPTEYDGSTPATTSVTISSHSLTSSYNNSMAVVIWFALTSKTLNSVSGAVDTMVTGNNTVSVHMAYKATPPVAGALGTPTGTLSVATATGSVPYVTFGLRKQ